MNNIKISKIIMTLFAVVLCFGPVGLAEPVGTAFTYQGRLIDSNNAADGLYDFQFKLFNANIAGNQVANDVNTPGTDVIDGYFTVLLDFGSVFNGNALWLEIGVRPGDQSDPNAYSLLSPRQKVTPTPYALAMRGILLNIDNTFLGLTAGNSNTTGSQNTFSGSMAGMSNTTGSANTFLGYNAGWMNTTGNSNTFSGYGAGYSNTTGSTNTFSGQFAGYSNTTGSFNTFSGLQAGYNNITGASNVFLGFQAGYNETGSNKLYIANSSANPPLIYGDFSAGNVGIGTTSPGAKLEVAGQVKITGGTPGAGKILTSDTVGLASWTSLPAGGDITAVNAGTGLSGGGTAGDVTLAVGVPLSLTGSVASPATVIDATNTGTGYGVRGKHNSTGNYGFLGSSSYGVYGNSSNSYGVYGYSGSATAVYGANGNGNNGRLGVGTSGVYGEGTGDYGKGVYGISTNSEGVYGNSNFGRGVYGASSTSEGIYGESFGNHGYGVYGINSTSGNYGYLGGNYIGVYGKGGSAGVYGESTSGWGVYGSSANNIGVYGSSANNIGVYGYGGSSSYDFYAGGTAINYGPFTGGHEVKLADDFPADTKVGMIVSVTGRTEVRRDDKGEISISSTLPTVKLCNVPNDKAVFGVFVAECPLPADHWYKEKEDKRFATVNALGEGRAWVCNINGEVQVGDYITTSAVPGYGQKQDDDLLRSCTLGKATESVDWDSVTETVEFGGQTYKIYLIGVVYTSG